MIALGCKVKDKITGFSGVVTGYVTYLTGCNQALVAPPCGENGSFFEPQWFDEQRLDVVENFEPIKLNNSSGPGFDKSPPVR